MIILAKFGVAFAFDFPLWQYADPRELRVDAVHASGDTKLNKDGAAAVNTANGFVDLGSVYSITLTAVEMQFKRVSLTIIDQGAKAWIDDHHEILTFGDASAMYPFDLGSASVPVAINGITSASIADSAYVQLATTSWEDGYVTTRQLSSDGLDNISTPTIAGLATTLPAKINQLFRLFFRKTTLTATQLKTFGNDGTTVLTTQVVSDNGTTQTKEAAT